MSVLREVRRALAAQLAAALGIRGYDVWPSTINPPILVVRPLSGSYLVAFEEDAANHQLEVTILLQLAHQEAAQEDMDAYLDPTGSKSVAAALMADPTISGTAGNAVVKGYRDYGGMTVGVDPDGQAPQYLGVKFDIEVYV